MSACCDNWKYSYNSTYCNAINPEIKTSNRSQTLSLTVQKWTTDKSNIAQLSFLCILSLCYRWLGRESSKLSIKTVKKTIKENHILVYKTLTKTSSKLPRGSSINKQEVFAIMARDSYKECPAEIVRLTEIYRHVGSLHFAASHVGHSPANTYRKQKGFWSMSSSSATCRRQKNSIRDEKRLHFVRLYSKHKMHHLFGLSFNVHPVQTSIISYIEYCI